MIKLVAFDWNGTLLSDTRLVVQAETFIMKKFGVPGKHSLKRAQEHFVIPIRNYWISLGASGKTFDKNVSKIAENFFTFYARGEYSCRSRSGVREIAAWCRDRKIRNIVFSNHLIPNIERQLHRLKLDKYFDAILARPLGDISHMQSRSKGDKLSAYVKSAKLKPSEVMVVGDTAEEIEIGKKFGYFSIAITGGAQSLARLKNAEPNYLIHNLIDLKKIITQINGRTSKRN